MGRRVDPLDVSDDEEGFEVEGPMAQRLKAATASTVKKAPAGQKARGAEAADRVSDKVRRKMAQHEARREEVREQGESAGEGGEADRCSKALRAAELGDSYLDAVASRYAVAGATAAGSGKNGAKNVGHAHRAKRLVEVARQRVASHKADIQRQHEALEQALASLEAARRQEAALMESREHFLRAEFEERAAAVRKAADAEVDRLRLAMGEEIRAQREACEAALAEKAEALVGGFASAGAGSDALELPMGHVAGSASVMRYTGYGGRSAVQSIAPPPAEGGHGGGGATPASQAQQPQHLSFTPAAATTAPRTARARAAQSSARGGRLQVERAESPSAYQPGRFLRKNRPTIHVKDLYKAGTLFSDDDLE